MNIRSKIILITIPLIITPLIITLIVSILSARNGITVVTTEFLTFKSKVLTNYMNDQWVLLVENDLDEDETFISITKKSVEDFSRTLIGQDSEQIFAIDNSGNTPISSSDLLMSEEDKKVFESIFDKSHTGWHQLFFDEKEYVAEISYFEPFDWYVVVSVERQIFYGEISKIIYRILVIFIASLIISVILLFLFSKLLTKPLENIVDAIQKIITTNDLSTKVVLQYKDETGKLGHYFNIMTGELDRANLQMKHFALQAVVAKRKESKIRNIFQKYVPKNVIDRFYSDPESMLVGENRVLAILFTDIRNFTTISEGLQPDDLVESLNKYFEIMVDAITKHNGIVDKYIGDAIMAFFGAPVHHENDALQSVLAGLEMMDVLEEFNEWQRNKGRAEFSFGIGINYGVVTIGNIGSEKKMDYTVIGDMVNLASRLEGLTKVYKEGLLISESLYNRVHDKVKCRMIDHVVVKGKTQSVKIYSVRKELTMQQGIAWSYHEQGLTHFYNRDFVKALSLFKKTKAIIEEDYCSQLFIERCQTYIETPPAPDWNGDIILEKK